MDPLMAASLAELEEIHDDLRHVVQDLPAEGLNWRPGEETSSLYVLVTHLLGSEHYLLAAAAGQNIARDRAAEFSARGDDAMELLRLLDEADARARELLAQVTPETLATTHGSPRSGAKCLLRALVHSGEHQGQALLTRQLWEASQSSVN